MNLYILKYNNYYNRIVKLEDSLSKYLPYQLGDTITDVNFVPHNGIATEQVVNRSLKDIGDYLLAVNDNMEIESKWFIIENTRLRNGQYKLTLRRDVIADNYSEVINAPCFIEKATLEQSDPMIYNSEDMTFNQIKTSESLLKDETGSAWIVGYLSADHTEDKTVQIDPQYLYDTIETLDEWEYKDNNLIWSVDPGGWTMNVSMKCATNGSTKGSAWHRYSFNGQGDQVILNVWDEPQPGIFGWDSVGMGQIDTIEAYESDSYFANLDKSSITYANIGVQPSLTVKNALKSSFVDVYPYMEQFVKSQPGYVNDVNALLNKIGKIYYVSEENKFYRLELIKTGGNYYHSITPTGAFYNTCRNAYIAAYNSNPQAFNTIYSNANNPNSFTFDISLKTANQEYRAVLTPIADEINYSVTISKNRPHLNDAPYDMFCIPYSDGFNIYKDGQPILTTNQNLSFGVAMTLQRELSGAGFIYDVQLLPYCPLRDYIKPDGTFDIQNGKVDFITKTENNQQVNAGIIIYAYNSSFTLNIPYTIKVTDKKIQNLCDMYRLCSPNYNGQFEFSVAKNNGVNYFNVDCTYKPYNPYIHINPNFGNLYGFDFNDSRGLICSGDFSLPAITDAWATYELQNKNYQQQFDRQIQNMQVNNSIALKQMKVQAAAGTVSAATTGAMTGGMLGGPIGAAIGGVIAGGASAAAAIADVSFAKQLQAEAIDYTQDQFGYQLGNIQALPYGLSKTTAFTYNNKIFPVLEYYTCTEQEKQALRNKLKYNGMTVMRIGSIVDFLQPDYSYIKGKLIRLESVGEDYHMVSEIANEINKGVFIK